MCGIKKINFLLCKMVTDYIVPRTRDVWCHTCGEISHFAKDCKKQDREDRGKEKKTNRKPHKV